MLIWLQTLSDLDPSLTYITEVAAKVRSLITLAQRSYIYTLIPVVRPTFLILFLFSVRTYQLNAFDSRHLDEIYFDVRLTAFQDATRRVKDMQTLDLDYINTIIHNCFHTYEVS